MLCAGRGYKPRPAEGVTLRNNHNPLVERSRDLPKIPAAGFNTSSVNFGRSRLRSTNGLCGEF